MTLEKMKEAQRGSGWWLHYVQINGYAFRPNPVGLKLLAAETGVRPSELSRCITTYLEA